jgi:hypothetical protein
MFARRAVEIHIDCVPGGVRKMSEQLTWVDVCDRLPDEGVTVLLFGDMDGEPVWPGYFDESTAHGDIWRTVDGMLIKGVTHWAEMPSGPKEVAK